jgi:hypothetical protein
MFEELDQWSENWVWIDDLLTLQEQPFAEYNTAESLARMDGEPLPWDDLIPADRHERWNGTIGKD